MTFKIPARGEEYLDRPYLELELLYLKKDDES